MLRVEQKLADHPAATAGALGCAVASALLFALANVALRMAPLAGAWNVALIRSVVFAIVLAPLLPLQGLSNRPVRPMRSKVAYALFVLTTIVTNVTWFAGLQALPFATATSLFSLKAAFALIAAVVLLNEQVSLRRIAALVVGFLGAAMLLEPDKPSIAGAAWVLAAAFSSALSGILYAQLVRAEPPARVLVISATVQLILLVPVTMSAALDLPAPILLLLATNAVLSIGTMYTLAWAYRGADVGLVSLMEYLRLPFAALLAYLFFAERPGASFFLGSALIVAGMICARPLVSPHGGSK